MQSHNNIKAPNNGINPTRRFAPHERAPKASLVSVSKLAVVQSSRRAWPVRRLGVFYNGRQVIEAGIKESKAVFASRHLPTRHQAGIALYQELVLFAQNLIRWFRRQCVAGSALAAASIKELVRIGTNSRAQLVVGADAILLCLAADSPWGGITP